MSVYDGADTQELLARYGDLMEKYVKLAKELAPKLEKFGKYRQELQGITVELLNRNITPQDSKELTETIQEELQQRDLKNV
jgi:hypothetical protein